MRRLVYFALRREGALDYWLRERLTLAGWLVAGAAGGAAAAGLDTNLTVTYRAFTFLAALFALSWAAPASAIEARGPQPSWIAGRTRVRRTISTT